MRLIDADALPVLHLAGWDGETLDMVSKAAIDAAPTAQPTAQERHVGHWIEDKYLTRNNICCCSECKSPANAYYLFCPCCGADMRGAAE